MFVPSPARAVALSLAVAVLTAARAQAQEAPATRPAVPDHSSRILTPAPPATPRINGPTVFGVRPGHPLLYSIPATGDRPMTFEAEGLPAGVRIDPATGRLSGRVAAAGTYAATLRARNALGSAEKPFRVVVGEEISLTPAMGWNSYNCFGERVTQDLALKAARKFIEFGLDRHGWMYINLDDGWQGYARDPNKAITADLERFPDIKRMVDEIHAMGLKAGLYHTPWTTSYGGRLGGTSEYTHGNWGELNRVKAPKNQRKLPFAIGPHKFVAEDARQFAAWGFDYLKYDWGPVEAPETKEMHDALRATGRDVVFSLSNNHVKNLIRVIDGVAPYAQSWRTTTDIRDVWGRVANDIGFAQEKWARHARPGHFNDADMLVVGVVGGWGGPDKLKPTRLTPDEQYSHISLWCLIASPLLIGTDLEQMDPFTLSLLTNDEVLDVNQDALCKQAVQVGGSGDVKVLAKPMEDGSLAVGLFNTGTTAATVTAAWPDLKLDGKRRVRDLWRQTDLGVFDGEFKAEVAPHGVVLVRVFAER